MEKIIKQINQMHRLAKIILHAGLPVLSLAFLVIFIFVKSPVWESWYIHRLLPAILENLMMSLTLLIGGALLVDYVIKSDRNQDDTSRR